MRVRRLRRLVEEGAAFRRVGVRRVLRVVEELRVQAGRLHAAGDAEHQLDVRAGEQLSLRHRRAAPRDLRVDEGQHAGAVRAVAGGGAAGAEARRGAQQRQM